MTLRREESSLGEKQLIELFETYDISDVEWLEENQMHDCCEAVSSPSSQSITSSIEEKSLNFFYLPTEIRISIYDLLLVSRPSLEEHPSWVIGNSDQKLIRLHRMRVKQPRTLHPAILRTCRKIYDEAVRTLYAKNAFDVRESTKFFKFAAQIGPSNVAYLRAFEIWVPRSAKIQAWLEVLRILNEEVTGLRVLQVGWDAMWDISWDLEGGERKGLGDNVEFARALGRIQGLDRFAIKGYYAANWPAYLEEKMKVKVQAKCGLYLELRKGYLDKDGKEDVFTCGLNEKQRALCEKYQVGTEKLMP